MSFHDYARHTRNMRHVPISHGPAPEILRIPFGQSRWNLLPQEPHDLNQRWQLAGESQQAKFRFIAIYFFNLSLIGLSSNETQRALKCCSKRCPCCFHLATKRPPFCATTTGKNPFFTFA
jgi:hypothetical protein